MNKIIFSSLILVFVLSIFSSTSYASLSHAEENETISPLAEPFSLVFRDSRLHIEFNNEHKNGMVSMFDILGNKVFELPANETVEYSLANLKSGLYFVVLKNQKGNFTRKFLHKQEG
jgi:hypothetical protein